LPEGHFLDKIKSIAVPVTRRAAGAGSKRARTATAIDANQPRLPQRSLAPKPAADKHRYRIGERVHMLGGGSNWSRSEALCRIVALLPHERGPLLYRVQSEAESYQRVVEETDLSSLR
jgi:hypothetical protein